MIFRPLHIVKKLFLRNARLNTPPEVVDSTHPPERESVLRATFVMGSDPNF